MCGLDESAACSNVVRVVGDDRGSVTVEAALGICSIMAVLIVCVMAVVTTLAQIAVIDSASAIARYAAIHGSTQAAGFRPENLPDSAVVSIESAEDRVEVNVEVRSVVLPGVVLRSSALAPLEPGMR